MRMIFRRANIKTFISSVGVIALFAVLGMFLHTPIFSAVRAVALPAGEVLWGGQANVFSWFDVRREAWQEKKELARENIVLQRERDELRAQLSAYESLKQENRELKEVLSWQAPEDAQLANVLTTPPLVSPYDTVVVDRGGQHGVLPGQFVFVGDTVIGTISQAALENAVVSLFSTPGRETQARVGEDNVPITLSGRGGGAFTATLPTEVPILPGGLIHIPDTEVGLIAEVVSIERTEQSPEQLIRARTPVNIFTLTRVLVGQ